MLEAMQAACPLKFKCCYPDVACIKAASQGEPGLRILQWLHSRYIRRSCHTLGTELAASVSMSPAALDVVQTPGQCLVVRQPASDAATDTASSSKELVLTVSSSPYQARRQSAPLDASIVEVTRSAWHAGSSKAGTARLMQLRSRAHFCCPVRHRRPSGLHSLAPKEILVHILEHHGPCGSAWMLCKTSQCTDTEGWNSIHEA